MYVAARDALPSLRGFEEHRLLSSKVRCVHQPRPPHTARSAACTAHSPSSFHSTAMPHILVDHPASVRLIGTAERCRLPAQSSCATLRAPDPHEVKRGRRQADSSGNRRNSHDNDSQHAESPSTHCLLSSDNFHLASPCSAGVTVHERGESSYNQTH